ncbi:MAG: thioredoxin [Actinomycetota bacterium]
MAQLVHNVVAPPKAERVLLLCHGFGSDEVDLGGLLPYLDPDGYFVTVLPRGPHGLPGGQPGYSWFGFGPEGIATDEYAASLDALDDLLDEVCAEHGMTRSAAVVGGFSQGGGMALALALRPSDRPHPAAALGLSTAVFADLDGLDAAAAPTLPVLLQHGLDDQMIPVARARETAERLVALGCPVVFEEYPMGHAVALESMQAARAWLDRIRSGERPTAAMPAPPPPGLVPAVTTARFETEVLRSEIPVIVDFWAPWCGPCRQVAPVVEQMASMRQGSYKFVKVNIDEEPQLAQAFNVQSIPLIGLFRNGRMERQSLGAKPRPQLEAELGMLVIP